MKCRDCLACLCVPFIRSIRSNCSMSCSETTTSASAGDQVLDEVCRLPDGSLTVTTDGGSVGTVFMTPRFAAAVTSVDAGTASSVALAVGSASAASFVLSKQSELWLWKA